MPDEVMDDVDGREVEARARRLGWVPQEEFKGVPGAWLPPAAYIEKVENDNATLRSKNRAADKRLQAMGEQLAEVQRQNAEITAALREVVDANKTNAQKAYAKGRADLERELRGAVADADVEKFDRVQAEIAALDRDAAAAARPASKAAATPDRPPATPQPDPVAAEWARSQPWFNGPESIHAAMTSFAVAEHGRLLKERPDMELSENLDEVTRRVQARFPDQFGDDDSAEEPPPPPPPPRTRQAASPVGRPGTAPSRTREKGWNELPDDAKAAYEKQSKYVNKGMPPEKQWTREQFAKEYWASN